MVWAIRGATTVSDNTADEIVAETQKLLKEMAEKNGLEEDDIISIILPLQKIWMLHSRQLQQEIWDGQVRHLCA